MQEGELSPVKQLVIKAAIDAEAQKMKKRFKFGKNLKVHCVFVAVTMVDNDGNVHIIPGGQTPEETSDFYRRLMVMHSRAQAREDDGC